MPQWLSKIIAAFKRLKSGDVAPPYSPRVGDRVEVVDNIPGMDVIPGDTYSITAVDEAGYFKINHGLGTRFDVFLAPKNFRIMR